MEWMDVLKLAGILLCLLGIINLRWTSTRWTAPGISLRVDALESEVHVIHGNLARVERDQIAWHREFNDFAVAQSTALEVIRLSINDRVSLRTALQEMTERISDMEQAIHGLPCSQENCPPEVKKK
jgi:hypothetical protein